MRVPTSPRRGCVLGQSPLVRSYFEDPGPAGSQRLEGRTARPSVFYDHRVATVHRDCAQRRQELPRRVRRLGTHVDRQYLSLENGDGLRSAANDRRLREGRAKRLPLPQRAGDSQHPLQPGARGQDDDGLRPPDRSERGRELIGEITFDFAKGRHADRFPSMTPDERRELALPPSLEERDASSAQRFVHRLRQATG